LSIFNIGIELGVNSVYQTLRNSELYRLSVCTSFARIKTKSG